MTINNVRIIVEPYGKKSDPSITPPKKINFMWIKNLDKKNKAINYFYDPLR